MNAELAFRDGVSHDGTHAPLLHVVSTRSQREVAEVRFQRSWQEFVVVYRPATRWTRHMVAELHAQLERLAAAAQSRDRTEIRD